jgi:hypothetical protein
MKYFKKYKHDPSFHSHLQISTAILVIVVIAAVGAHLLVSSHAQSPYSAAYAANGTLGGVASLISGGSNVNDQAVQFGSAGSGQNITGSPAGISVGYTFTVNWANEAAATRATTITQMKADDVNWIRVDIYPGYGNDSIVQAAVAAGIKVDAIIQNNTTPAVASTYAPWAAQAATHLASEGVNTFELLNEPNGCEDTISASGYAALLVAAYPAIKAADPNAFVLTAGLCPGTGDDAPATYLQSLYSDGAGGYFDAVAVHPYFFQAMSVGSWQSYYLDSWSAWYQMDQASPSVRSVMVANGDSNKQIWITEWGCPTGTDGGYTDSCTDATVAQQIPVLYDYVRSKSYFGPMFVYDWIDDSINQDGDFGLCYADSGGTSTSCDSPKTATVAAYKAVASE